MLDKEQLLEIHMRVRESPAVTTFPKTVCPKCGGGSSAEKSFGLWRRDGLIYFKCFRSSCGTRGATPETVSGDSVLRSKPRSFIPRVFDYPTTSVPDRYVEAFEENYGITEQELLDNNIVYCSSRDSLVFPLYNFMGGKIGVLERTFPKWQNGHVLPHKRKSLTYMEEDFPAMYFPLSCTISTQMAVVEDTLSAIKLGRLVPTCALLGTGLSRELLVKIKELGVEDLFIMLDPDAINKSIEIKSDIDLFFPNIRVIFLEKDPKDSSMEDLQTALEKL